MTDNNKPQPRPAITDLLWAQPVIPESALAPAIDLEALDALLHSRKFQTWKPSPPPSQLRRRSRKASAPASDAAVETAAATEKHEKVYTVAQVAAMWSISKDLVRDLFRDDPDVLKFERPAARFKRAYMMLRIPESAVTRVHAKLKASRC